MTALCFAKCAIVGSIRHGCIDTRHTNAAPLSTRIDCTGTHIILAGCLSIPFNDLAACAAEALRLIKVVGEQRSSCGWRRSRETFRQLRRIGRCQSKVLRGKHTLFNGNHNKWPIGDAHARYKSAIHSSNAIRTHDSAIRPDHRASKVSRRIFCTPLLP